VIVCGLVPLDAFTRLHLPSRVYTSTLQTGSKDRAYCLCGWLGDIRQSGCCRAHVHCSLSVSNEATSGLQDPLYVQSHSMPTPQPLPDPLQRSISPGGFDSFSLAADFPSLTMLSPQQQQQQQQSSSIGRQQLSSYDLSSGAPSIDTLLWRCSAELGNRSPCLPWQSNGGTSSDTSSLLLCSEIVHV